MSISRHVLEELISANRILAHEGVVDAFGHVSIRHPEAPDRYLMSRARAPECIEIDDFIEFTLDGAPVEAIAPVGSRMPSGSFTAPSTKRARTCRRSSITTAPA